MKQHAFRPSAALAGSVLCLASGAGLLAGEPAPYVPAPAPVTECGNPGWTLTAAALYLKSYAGSSNSRYEGDYEGEFDWGFRGSLGYERPDGHFLRLVGFWHEGDHDYESDGDPLPGGRAVTDGTTKAYAVDLLIGDTFCPTANTSLEVSAGIRYGGSEFETKWRQVVAGLLEGRSESDFDGWGPTVQIRARRALTDRIALYADLQQSLLFGETESKERQNLVSSGTTAFAAAPQQDRTTDTLASVSEIRGGIEFLWGWNAIRNAWLRLGAEGQYWWIDSADMGLMGAAAEVGFTF